MNHFTDKDGANGIRSQPVWNFRAAQPPGDHPFGAYFTSLDPGTPNLAKRLRIPRSKLAWVFSFTGEEGLQRLPGGRGEFIWYSQVDYLVEASRQARIEETNL